MKSKVPARMSSWSSSCTPFHSQVLPSRGWSRPARFSLLGCFRWAEVFLNLPPSKHLYKCLWCSTALLSRVPNHSGNPPVLGLAFALAFPPVRELSRLAFVLRSVASHVSLDVEFETLPPSSNLNALSWHLLDSPSMLRKSQCMA